MNKQLEKKIERVENLKAKEVEKVNAINLIISDYDKQLKILKDYQKEQEKIYKMQQDLDNKIKDK